MANVTLTSGNSITLTVGDNSIVLDTIAITGSASLAALGTPTDGSFADGYVALTPSTSVTNAIDAINEALLDFDTDADVINLGVAPDGTLTNGLVTSWTSTTKVTGALDDLNEALLAVTHGTYTFTSLTVSGALSAGSLAVSGTTALTGLLTAVNATLSGTLGVTGAITGGSYTGGAIGGTTGIFSGAITGASYTGGAIGGTTGTFSGAVTVGTTLGVTGVTTLSGLLAGASATLSGTLGVTGAITGASYTGGAIGGTTGIFSGAVTVGTTLGVTGLATVAGLAMGASDTIAWSGRGTIQAVADGLLQIATVAANTGSNVMVRFGVSTAGLQLRSTGSQRMILEALPSGTTQFDAGEIVATRNVTSAFRSDQGSVRIGSTARFGLSSGSGLSTVMDVALARVSAGVAALYNAETGTVLADLQLGNLTASAIAANTTPSATLPLISKGTGATSSTYSAAFYNSTQSNTYIAVRNDGLLEMSSTITNGGGFSFSTQSPARAQCVSVSQPWTLGSGLTPFVYSRGGLTFPAETTGVVAMTKATGTLAGAGFSFDGTISGMQRYVQLKTTAYSLVAADSGNVFQNTGAGGQVVYTLPAAAVGLQYEIINTAAGATFSKLLAVGTDVIAYNGAVGAAAGSLTSAAIWTFFRVTCHSAGVWTVTGTVGTPTLA